MTNINMNRNNKTILQIVLSIMAFGISLLSLAPIANAKATATDTTITRTLSTTNPTPGSTFD